MATEFSYLSSSSTSHGESLFDRTINVWLKSSGWLDWPRREHRCTENIHECHTPSCSSSWSRLNGESTIYREWTPEVCETVLPSACKVVQGSDRNPWSDHDWLQRTYVDIDDSTMWQSDWDYDCQNQCLRRLGALSRKYQWPASRSLEKLNGIWEIDISTIWIELIESRWSSSGKYSQDSLHWEHSRRDSKKDDWITVWTWEVQRKDPYEFSYSCELCSQIIARTLVIFGDLDQRRNLFW